MQKRKKQLLGFAGLALVVGMTAVALSLPAAATNPGTTTITVEVTDNRPDGQAPSAQITSPQNNADLTEIPGIAVAYSKVRNISLKVTRTRTVIGENGETSTAQDVVATLTYAPTADSGTWTVSAAQLLAELGNQTPVSGDNYELSMTAYGENDSTVKDTVSFNYRAMTVVFNGDTAENRDPMVKVTANSTVTRFVMQVYNDKSTPLFVDADGKEEPLSFTREILDSNGIAMVTLPFGKYNIPAGEYELVTMAFNAAGEYVSMNRTKVKYAPETPEVPGTGAMAFGNLNISRADYLVTGLIAFSAMVGFAIYLVFRKSRR